jgi:hypothetical protein
VGCGWDTTPARVGCSCRVWCSTRQGCSWIASRGASLAWLILCLQFVVVTLAHAPRAHAQVAPDDAPAFVPRRVAVMSPVRIYIAPSLADDSAGLGSLSLPEVAASVRQRFASDPRFDTLNDVPERLAAQARAPSQADVLFVSERSVELGREHVRAYNLASAATELEAAINGYNRTAASWTMPRNVAEAWEALALTYLERAQVEPENAADHEARAMQAFGELIRVSPTRDYGPNAYPAMVVQAHREAYTRHWLNDGSDLRMRPGEANQLSGWLSVDYVVSVFAMVDAAGPRIVIQVWNTRAGRFVHDEVVAVPEETEAAATLVDAAVSRVVACLPLVPPTDAQLEDNERGSVYLSAGYATGAFLGTPTRRRFFQHGATLSLAAMLTENVGLRLSGSQWSARRDRDGDLITKLESIQLTAGVITAARLGRLRLSVDAALDVTRIGAVKATTSFWCKVSEGDPFVFDDGRECDAADIVDRAAQVQAGPQFGVGVGAQLAGPLWIDLRIHLTLYVAPFDNRAFDTPFGLNSVLTYRF